MSNTIDNQRLTEMQEKFKDLKFGLFIHWGISALPPALRTLDNFIAESFSAREWVDIAKEAGQKYIAFTSKHHDGFCLFDSSLTDYTSTHTPAKVDFLKLLADECY